VEVKALSQRIEELAGQDRLEEATSLLDDLRQALAKVRRYLEKKLEM